jgi:hypothetical protein
MLRELDRRRLDTGEAIGLYWDDASGEVAVTVEGPGDEERQAAAIPPNEALDAFRHPFLYLERHRGFELEPEPGD